MLCRFTHRITVKLLPVLIYYVKLAAPRKGDALVWSNTIDSEVDADMVHMGKPPSKAGIEKYAVNVWFGEE